jgi:hypothetical protein
MIEQEFLSCYYRPAFFKMKIDLHTDLSNLNEISDGAFSLYLHEYIHFIQDISTIYGLMNISTINYYLQDCAHRIHKEGLKEFQVPFSLRNDKDDFGFNNFQLRPIYIGSPINPKHTFISIDSYQLINNKFGSGELDIVQEVLVYFTNNESSDLQSFKLGGNHITEGMAFLCESYIYSDILSQQGHTITADEYPYKVVKKLAEQIYPELSNYDILIIAICDNSLMTYHPGLSYVRLLEELKRIDFINRYSENEEIITELYKIAIPFLKGNHYDFNIILDTVRSEIKKSFKVEHFEGNNQWIDIIFDRIKAFREKRPEFLIDIILLGDPKKNELFGAFHKLIGSPLVINADYEGTISIPTGFDPKNFHPYLFWAINQLLRIFSDNKPTPCELIDYCKKSKVVDEKIIIDDRCYNSPWKRYNDDNLCPMGIMWKHWSLAGFEPKKNKKNSR